MRNFTFHRVAPVLFALGTSLGAVGCVEELGPVGEGGGATSIPAEVRAALDNSCATAGCHAGTGAAAGLNLEGSAANSIFSANGSTGIPMVTLGDVGNSYLAIKCLPSDSLQLYGVTRTGSKMPLGGNADSARDVAVIVGWIAGAIPPAKALEQDEIPVLEQRLPPLGADGETGWVE